MYMYMYMYVYIYIYICMYIYIYTHIIIIKLRVLYLNMISTGLWPQALMVESFEPPSRTCAHTNEHNIHNNNNDMITTIITITLHYIWQSQHNTTT